MEKHVTCCFFHGYKRFYQILYHIFTINTTCYSKTIVFFTIHFLFRAIICIYMLLYKNLPTTINCQPGKAGNHIPPSNLSKLTIYNSIKTSLVPTVERLLCFHATVPTFLNNRGPSRKLLFPNSKARCHNPPPEYLDFSLLFSN